MENKRTSAGALAALKSACEKRTFKSFKNLENGEYYVTRFSHVDTLHGKRVQIDLADSYMYLPERYLTKLPEDVCKDLSKTPKIMIYGGKDANGSNRLILDFKDVEYFNEIFNHEFASEFVPSSGY